VGHLFVNLNPTECTDGSSRSQSQEGHTENAESDRQTAAELARSNVAHLERSSECESTSEGWRALDENE